MENSRSILYLDSEKRNLNVFKANFKNHYFIHMASDMREAFEILDNNFIKVVISSQKFLGTTGFEFLKEVKEMYPDTVRIMLTGYIGIDVTKEAFSEYDIYQYVTKPWSINEFKLILDEALEVFDLTRV